MRDSPWQIPNVKTTTTRSLDGAAEFGRNASFPREWGAGMWKLLRLSLDGTSKSLKAHEYLVMIRSSLLAILAAWPRDDDTSKNLLAPLIGKLTTIIRELTSHKIALKVRCRKTLNLHAWPHLYHTYYGHVRNIAGPVAEYGHTLA